MASLQCSSGPHCALPEESVATLQLEAILLGSGLAWVFAGITCASSRRCVCALHAGAVLGLYPALYLLTVGLCAFYWISRCRALALTSLFHMVSLLHFILVPLSSPALKSALTVLLGTVSSTQQFLLHCATSFSSLYLCMFCMPPLDMLSVRIHGAPTMCQA